MKKPLDLLNTFTRSLSSFNKTHQNSTHFSSPSSNSPQFIIPRISFSQTPHKPIKYFSVFGSNPSILFLGSTQIRPFSSSKDPMPMESTSSPSNSIPVVSTVSSPFEDSPPIDASSSMRKPICLWPGMYQSPVTNALWEVLWEARSSNFERLLDPSKDGPAQSELLNKTPSQSRTSIHYNFWIDYMLREQYRDPWNEVKIGKLLEDLDVLAGTIAVKSPQSSLRSRSSTRSFSILRTPTPRPDTQCVDLGLSTRRGTSVFVDRYLRGAIGGWTRLLWTMDLKLMYHLCYSNYNQNHVYVSIL